MNEHVFGPASPQSWRLLCCFVFFPTSYFCHHIVFDREDILGNPILLSYLNGRRWPTLCVLVNIFPFFALYRVERVCVISCIASLKIVLQYMKASFWTCRLDRAHPRSRYWRHFILFATVIHIMYKWRRDFQFILSHQFRLNYCYWCFVLQLWIVVVLCSLGKC